MAVAQLTGIAVVVFDLDDTLYPERQFAESGFEAVGRWLRERMACPGDPARRMRELLAGGHRGRVFNQLLAEWGYTETEIWVPQMIECYRTHEPQISLYSDASSALDRWQGTFQLALISDGPVAMQWNKLRALGLDSRLRPIILTDQWGESYRKPHVRAFEEVQSRAGQRGPKCLYIADNLAKDFVAPVRLGWRTVCVRQTDGVYADAIPPEGGSPEFQVASLDDVTVEE